MKKLSIVILSLALIVGLSGVACAIPYTWVDTYAPEDGPILFAGVQRDNAVQSLSFTHDITDDGFDLWPEDVVLSYDLVIDVYDDGDGQLEWALFDLPGSISDERVEVDYFNVDLGMSWRGWLQLNEYGTLGVTIDRLRGDFYFGSSTLTAYGCESNPAPVPEPATMLLLGTGIAGMAAVRRRKKSQ